MRERDIIAVYILASTRNGTLYVGVTSDLKRRIYQHKTGRFEGFAKKYGCKLLMWFETHERVVDAIRREKVLKKHLRGWKLNLIEAENPHWRDLSEDLFEPGFWELHARLACEERERQEQWRRLMSAGARRRPLGPGPSE